MESHTEDNTLEVLDYRLRYFQEYLEPYYKRCFSSHGLSDSHFDLSKHPLAIEHFANLFEDAASTFLSEWLANRENSKDTEQLISELIKQVLDFTIRPLHESQSTSSQTSTTGILPHLNISAPGSLYFDLGLDQSSRNFRILEVLPTKGDRLECVLKVSCAPKSTNYEALSYVWGQPSPTKVIIVNGIEQKISLNLYSALQALRKSKRQYLWVDALCINQADEHEKGWQVAMMADIYRNAENVLIYLGEEDAETAALFNFVNRTHDLDKESTIDEIAGRCGIDIHALLVSYYKFCSRSWFTRVWVCQEFAAARSPPFWFCGSYTTSTGVLQRDLEILFTRCVESQVSWTKDSAGDVNLIQLDNYNKFISKLIEATRIIFQPGLVHFHFLPCIIYRDIKRECTNPRDIVFGMREMLDPGFRNAFYPDYKMPLEDLFLRLSAWLLILDHWGDVFYSYPRRYSSNAPSWVRDFSQMPVVLNTTWGDNRHVGLPMICGIRERVWYVEGVILDEVLTSFDIDEELDFEVFSRIWSLDQYFMNPERVADKPDSLLAGLRTTYSLAYWAIDGSTEESTILTSMHVVRSLLNIPYEVAGPRLDFCNQKLAACNLPKHELAPLEPTAASQALEDSGREHTQWTDRLCSLMDLLTHIINSANSREDIIGASLFDYDNMRGQILASECCKTQKFGPDNSIFLPLKYNDTLEFLKEKDDPDLTSLLLEIIAAIKERGVEFPEIRSSTKISDTTTQDYRDYREKAIKDITKRTEEYSSQIARFRDLSINTETHASTLSAAHTLLKDLTDKNSPANLLLSAPIYKIQTVSNQTIQPFKHCTFFVTQGGLPGVGTPGVRDIRAGDKLVWLDDMMFPIVLRESVTVEASRSEFREVIGTVKVSGIMAGRMRRELGDKFPPNRQFRIV